MSVSNEEKNKSKLGYELLSNFKFYSNYSKYDEVKGKYESWNDSVDRVFDQMHGIKFKEELENNPKFKEYYDYAKQYYKDKYVLASQRSLQFGGAPILKHNAKIFNCTVSYCDRVRFFQEAMYMLLCGCGVGFSVQNLHIDKLSLIKKRSNRSKVFVVPDSIEGWADAIGILMSSYFDGEVPFPKYQNCHVSFDYSEIRGKGEHISGGFKAPGSSGLRTSIQKIEELLEKELDKPNFNGKIRSIIAYDIIMHISDAVLSGGVRRSASICLFSPDDTEMIKAKTGNWFLENPQRARSNNTVLLNRNTLTKEEFHSYFESVKQHGEPGFGFTYNPDIVYNPCQPAWAKVLTPDGIREFKDINVGDIIWSSEGWTNITNKWSTGIKKVYRYGTTFNCFYGTENHKVLDNNEKIEVKDAINIDLLRGISKEKIKYNNRVVMDGLVLGDGTVHKASNNLVLLCIGKDDSDYFDSEISNLIYKKRDGVGEYQYEIRTSITSDELVKTYNRKVPERYLNGNNDIVCSFLRGLYSANGSIVSDRITLKSASFKLIEDVQLMLNSIGITSYYTTNKPIKVKFSNGEYQCKESYDLNITRDRNKFQKLIGFIQIYKNEKLNKVIENKTGSTIEILSKKIIKKEFISEEEVFDITVDNNSHTYWTQGSNVSNCFEIGMLPKTKEGISGWECCNLVEINGGKCSTEKEFYDTCKAASIIGTLQAAYTDFKYLMPESKEICNQEALLGCSITGFMNNPNILLNPRIQRKGANIIKEINKEVAQMIGIRQAARTTCVKPSGNASVLLSTSSGIHGEHSEYYIRNVQANKEDDIAKYFFENNPKMVENSVWSANNTDWVISFPIIANKDSIFKDQLHGVKLLEYVKLTQQNWVEEGTNIELCTDPTLRHNVSNTVVVDNWDEVENYIFENRNFFAGVSLLPMTGDKDFNQAPFTSILMPEQLLKKYGESVFFVSGLIVDSLSAFNNNLWLACDTILGNGEKLEYTEKEVEEKIKFSTPRELWEKLGFKNGTLDKLSSLYIKPEVEEYKRYMDSKLNSNIHNYVLKKDWVRRAKQFSIRYFSSDKEMIYCLKDVHNYHKWVEITREINDIDWDNLSIEPKYTDIDTLGAVACSGGACEV